MQPLFPLSKTAINSDNGINVMKKWLIVDDDVQIVDDERIKTKTLVERQKIRARQNKTKQTIGAKTQTRHFCVPWKCKKIYFGEKSTCTK
jgi:hypothetical protein